jgi:hypothetical protein
MYQQGDVETTDENDDQKNDEKYSEAMGKLAELYPNKPQSQLLSALTV